MLWALSANQKCKLNACRRMWARACRQQAANCLIQPKSRTEQLEPNNGQSSLLLFVLGWPTWLTAFATSEVKYWHANVFLLSEWITSTTEAKVEWCMWRHLIHSDCMEKEQCTSSFSLLYRRFAASTTEYTIQQTLLCQKNASNVHSIL